MSAPESLIEHLARDQYHPRSDSHSNAVCRGVIADLLASCDAIRKRAAAGELVAKINHRVRVGYQDWTIDLAIGPAIEPSTTVVGASGISDGVPATVEIALEVKGVMTEHGKARFNRLRDFHAFHAHAHQYNQKTIAVGVVVVNVAEVFWSPTRGQTDITAHRNMDALGRATVDLFRNISLRNQATDPPGMEAMAAIVIDFDNLAKNPDPPEGTRSPQPPRLVTGPPAPDPGDPLHYATMLHRVCSGYRERWL